MRKLAVAVAAVLMGITLAPARAMASDPPWTAYDQTDFTVSGARSTCGFDVRVATVEDAEYYRTMSTYDDGSVMSQLWRGPLVMSYTNLTTGYSVVRDLTGMAVIDYRQGGALAKISAIEGSFGATLPAGSTPSSGLMVFSGHDTSVSFNADGSRSYELGPDGAVENMCQTLG